MARQVDGEVDVDPSLRSRVLGSLIGAFEAAERHEAPFAHVHLRGPFPDDVYAEIVARMPPHELYRRDHPYRHRREDGTSTRDVLGLDEGALARFPGPTRDFWDAIAGALSAPELRRVVFEVLGTAARLPAPQAAHPRPGLTRDVAGYEIAPHPDSRAKIVTVQLYLARSEDSRALGTTLYRRRLLKLENLRAPRRMYEPAEDVPFEANTGYAFAVGRRTWHGRSRLPESTRVRSSILLFYYRDPRRGW